MKDFNLKQYLTEGTLNKSDSQTVERFESTTERRNLKLLKDMIRFTSTDWMDEGFDKEDIKNYINGLIEEV